MDIFDILLGRAGGGGGSGGSGVLVVEMYIDDDTDKNTLNKTAGEIVAALENHQCVLACEGDVARLYAPDDYGSVGFYILAVAARTQSGTFEFTFMSWGVGTESAYAYTFTAESADDYPTSDED